MTQIMVIHGGTTYKNYDDYVYDLAHKTVHLDRLMYKPMWRERLQETLGSEYTVLIPSMPNKTNARYSEWKEWFDNLSTTLEDEVILIGHSLGAIFLVKYLSENRLSRRIKATILVAAPYDDETTEDLTDFKISGVSAAFSQQAGTVVFYFGFDDPVINASEIEKYKRDVPDAEFNLLPAPDHFMRPDFPEIISKIKTL